MEWSGKIIKRSAGHHLLHNQLCKAHGAFYNVINFVETYCYSIYEYSKALNWLECQKHFKLLAVSLEGDRWKFFLFETFYVIHKILSDDIFNRKVWSPTMTPRWRLRKYWHLSSVQCNISILIYSYYRQRQVKLLNNPDSYRNAFLYL